LPRHSAHTHPPPCHLPPSLSLFVILSCHAHTHTRAQAHPLWSVGWVYDELAHHKKRFRFDVPAAKHLCITITRLLSRRVLCVLQQKLLSVQYNAGENHKQAINKVSAQLQRRDATTAATTTAKLTRKSKRVCWCGAASRCVLLPVSKGVYALVSFFLLHPLPPRTTVCLSAAHVALVSK
jgi:hypothetical protein